MRIQTIFGVIIAIVMLASTVAADTMIRTDTVDAQAIIAQGGSATFAFISGRAPGTVAGTYSVGTCGKFEDILIGASCKVGQYVRPMQCRSAPSGDCVYILQNDWQRVGADYLPTNTFINEKFFTDMAYTQGRSCLIYQCIDSTSSTPGTPAPATGPSQATLAAPSVPESSGQFATFAAPASANVNDKIHITGSYKAATSGQVVLEATVLPAGTTFGILSSSSSPCDGSLFFSGLKVNAVAGQTYTFDFLVKTPLDQGNYLAVVWAWTACAKDNGKQIAVQNKPIKINKPYVSLFSPGCGTKDSDGDSVPDLCDRCPNDFGTITNNGCHPCWGMSPLTTEGALCWKTYQKDFGIPAQIQAQLNPVVGGGTRCSGNAIAKFETYKDGTEKVLATEPCAATDTCSDAANGAQCSAAKISTGKSYICTGSQVDLIQKYSDGSQTTLASNVDNCQYGCSQGACNPKPAPKTEIPVTTPDPQCKTDNDCSSTQYCANGGTCVEKGGCTSNSECTSTQTCTAGVCLENKQTECTKDSNCKASEHCFSGYCLPNSPVVTNSSTTCPANGCDPCTADKTMTCADGSTVVTGHCINGELQPAISTCVSPSQEVANPQGVSAPAGTEGTTGTPSGASVPPSAQGFTTWIQKNPAMAIVGALVIVGGGLWYYNNTKGRKGRRRRR